MSDDDVPRGGRPEPGMLGHWAQIWYGGTPLDGPPTYEGEVVGILYDPGILIRDVDGQQHMHSSRLPRRVWAHPPGPPRAPVPAGAITAQAWCDTGGVMLICRHCGNTPILSQPVQATPEQLAQYAADHRRTVCLGPRPVTPAAS